MKKNRSTYLLWNQVDCIICKEGHGNNWERLNEWTRILETCRAMIQTWVISIEPVKIQISSIVYWLKSLPDAHSVFFLHWMWEGEGGDAEVAILMNFIFASLWAIRNQWVAMLIMICWRHLSTSRSVMLKGSGLNSNHWSYWYHGFMSYTWWIKDQWWCLM